MRWFPRHGRKPDDLRPQRVAGVFGTRVFGQRLGGVVKDGLGHDFRGRVLVLETDHPVAVTALKSA